jgi:hypothetical protein
VRASHANKNRSATDRRSAVAQLRYLETTAGVKLSAEQSALALNEFVVVKYGSSSLMQISAPNANIRVLPTVAAQRRGHRVRS